MLNIQAAIITLFLYNDTVSNCYFCVLQLADLSLQDFTVYLNSGSSSIFILCCRFSNTLWRERWEEGVFSWLQSAASPLGATTNSAHWSFKNVESMSMIIIGLWPFEGRLLKRDSLCNVRLHLLCLLLSFSYCTDYRCTTEDKKVTCRQIPSSFKFSLSLLDKSFSPGTQLSFEKVKICLVNSKLCFPTILL